MFYVLYIDRRRQKKNILTDNNAAHMLAQKVKSNRLFINFSYYSLFVMNCSYYPFMVKLYFVYKPFHSS